MDEIFAGRYSDLPVLLATIDPGSPEQGFTGVIVPYLTTLWLDNYGRTSASANVVETRVNEFSYLFDVQAERLIAAWGSSRGRHGGERDHHRMAGHPNSAGPLYHRGHAIPHTLGGPTDINLVPQLGKVNIGPFRPLERRAVATPGSFYFTYWTYHGAASVRGRDGRHYPSQMPTGVDQGLLVPGEAPLGRHHWN